MKRQATRLRLLIVTAVALSATAAVPIQMNAQSSNGAPRLLDVPYVPQSEDLCGGAAAAMVMRYWGARDIYADAFAPLVERDAGGIRPAALVQALRQRGWTAISGPGDPASAQRQLGLGRPVIALIEDRPGRFHYVVVVAWTASRVIAHDPARAPFRALDRESFEAAWRKSDRWMLVALPPADLRTARTDERTTEAKASAGGACGGIVSQGVALANSGDRGGARRTLEAAAASCPNEAAAWRELAGLDAVEGAWPAAAEHARVAIHKDGSDAFAWRVLATAEYVGHDDIAALEAWNRVGEPQVDLVRITGLTRTRYPVIERAIDTPPHTVLTPDRLRLAQRRATDVPALAVARITFQPLENGRAQVDAAVVERRAAPSDRASLVRIGLGAAVERELSASFASPSGGGELVSATWRWWEHRAREAVAVAAPAPAGLGVWRVEASHEMQTFSTSLVKERQTHAALAIGNWLTSRVRIEGAVGADDWRMPSGSVSAGAPDRKLGTVSGRILYWPLEDRVSVDARGAASFGRGAFRTASLQATWLSSARMTGSVWLARGGAQVASEAAPASTWPGADIGHARPVLLRAHPLLDDGVITGGVFGRRLISGGTELRRWMQPSKWPLRVAPAAFVDIARASRGPATTDGRAHVDAGVGLRLWLAGMAVLRVDVARGLRDGRTAVSMAIER